MCVCGAPTMGCASAMRRDGRNRPPRRASAMTVRSLDRVLLLRAAERFDGCPLRAVARCEGGAGGVRAHRGLRVRGRTCEALDLPRLLGGRLLHVRRGDVALPLLGDGLE